jgi:parallel beta-helix repeat protein
MRTVVFSHSKGIMVARLWLMLIIVFCSFLIVCPDSHSSHFLSALNTDRKQIQEILSIQQAINQAENGSTIHIPAGTYYEHVTINKSISLLGEDKLNTIIDGSNAGTVVEITADNVTISGFVLQNSGYGWTNHGVYVYKANNCRIEDNSFYRDCHNIKLNYSRNIQVLNNLIYGVMAQPTMYGIRVQNSINCTVSDNQVSDCVGAIHLENATECTISRNLLQGNSQGIRLYTPCTYNEIRENTVYNNTYDGMIDTMPNNSTLFANRFYHNNFIGNTNPFIYQGTSSSWDNGYPSGGNHWSRHNVTDSYMGEFQNETGYDGIGDTAYNVTPYDKDRYPLIHPFGSVRNVETNTCYLTIQSAINASGVLAGHEIFVKSGIYREHIIIRKPISLIGENQTTTVIDGGGVGRVVTVEADNVSVVGFSIQNSGLNYPPYGNDCGLLLDHSVDGNINSNIFAGNRIGMYLLFSEQNHLEDNVVFSNTENGIWLWYSGHNTLRRNSMFNSTYSFGVFGNCFGNFDNSIDVTNNVEGKPIQYVVGCANEVFDDSKSISSLYLINCVNITVRNLNLTGNGQGVFCYNVTNSHIQNLTASRNNYGLDLLSSYNNTVSNNYCENNWVGIRLESSANNTVKSNTLVGGEKGISLYEADTNRVEGNNIRNSIFGIRLSTSHSNLVFRNNFIENVAQADLVSSNQNAWDDGYEGNFWSGNHVRDSDKDGIADDEYVVDAGDQDRFPLSGSYHGFEVNHEADYEEVGVISNSTVLGLAFEESDNAIVLTVNGSSEAFGFCRVRVPHTLIKPELNVIIDGGLVEVAHANYSLLDDGVYRWIYFEYEHSTREVVIVPEFHGLGPWLLIIVLTVSLILFLKGKRMNV